MKVREMDIELYRNYMNTLEAGSEPRWQYDEMKPCGVNYNGAWCSLAYDRRQQGFRDYKTESKNIIALLGLDKNQKVIDMGCGTGAFAINAAKHLKKVYAVDVSKAMLRRARKKARKAKLDNIEFSKGGFLTYTHNAEPVDAIVSMSALHHLPDFWKMIGLQRLARMVKTGGKIYIKDVVFSFDLARYESRIKAFIQIMLNRTEPGMKWDLETHFRQEYSTCGWVMEGLLERAGFRIDKADYKDDFFATYLCTKKGE
jgi:putative AdoMet-dependent methyltransferase